MTIRVIFSGAPEATEVVETCASCMVGRFESANFTPKFLKDGKIHFANPICELGQSKSSSCFDSCPLGFIVKFGICLGCLFQFNIPCDFGAYPILRWGIMAAISAQAANCPTSNMRMNFRLLSEDTNKLGVFRDRLDCDVRMFDM